MIYDWSLGAPDLSSDMQPFDRSILCAEETTVRHQANLAHMANLCVISSHYCRLSDLHRPAVGLSS